MNQILNGESAEAKVAPKSVVKLPLTPGKPKIASDFEVYKYDKIRVTAPFVPRDLRLKLRAQRTMTPVSIVAFPPIRDGAAFKLFGVARRLPLLAQAALTRSDR
jgi:hypothetical protein